MKTASELSDDELFDELREQVNQARFGTRYNSARTREISAEAAKRGWSLGKRIPAPRGEQGGVI